MLSAVVAHRRPLERNLVRFLVEEAGFAVVAEAATAPDTVRAISEHRPVVVVIHETAAVYRRASVVPRMHRPAVMHKCTSLHRGASVVPRIRRASPSTRVIVITSNDNVAAADLFRAADAIVDEGAAMQQLGFALAGTRQRVGLPTRAVDAPIAFSGTERPPHRPRLEYLQRAAAASILILAVVIAGSFGGSPPINEAPGAVRVHLTAAHRSLDNLADRVATADPATVASLARTLIMERAVALASGADISALDREVADTLGPLLPSLSNESRSMLVVVLGGLLTDSEPTPLPDPTVEASPQPEPRPSPQPTPSPEPSPQPSETQSPSPEPSPSPSPSQSPSETPSPSPSESPSETPSPSPSQSPSETPSPSPLQSPSEIASPTPEPAPSEMASPTPELFPSDELPAEADASPAQDPAR